MKKLLISLVALGGCVYKGPHVPSDLQGDVPIRIANKTADPICAVLIMPFNGQASHDNWLGDGFRQKAIAPGGEREFKIKPGDYRVGAGACNSKWAAGTQQGKLAIQSATYVAVGGPGEAPPSYRLVSLPVVGASQLAPAGGGAAQPAEATEPSEPAEATPDCKPDGAVVSDYGDCCTNNFSHVGDHYVCCDPSKHQCK